MNEDCDPMALMESGNGEITYIEDMNEEEAEFTIEESMPQNKRKYK